MTLNKRGVLLPSLSATAWELLFIYVGGSVYKASGAPVDAFLCRTLKGEDHIRAIPSALIIVTKISNKTLRWNIPQIPILFGMAPIHDNNGADAVACQQPESNTSSGNLQRVLQRHQAALTGYGGGPSVYDPPPPYSGPAPSFNAPPPPYYGPQLPYYEPPPPYSETEPVPRLQPAPVQYEASRPCQLGTRLREDIFYYVGGGVYKASSAPVDTFLCRTLKGEDHLQNVTMIFPLTYPTVQNTEPRRRRCDCGCEDNDYDYQEAASTYADNILRGEISSQYDPPPPPYPGPGPSNDAPPPPYWTLYGPKMPYYEPPPPYIETTPAPRPQPVPVQYEASRPCKLGRNLRKDLFYINVMVPISMPANFSVRPQTSTYYLPFKHLPTIFHSSTYLLSSVQASTFYLPLSLLLLHYYPSRLVHSDLVNSGTFTPKSAGLPCIIDGWTTAELRATYLLNRLLIQDSVLDAFCGAGGNTIQFARTCNRVVAIDIDPNKIAMAKHNATIYGVHEKIEFITGDFFELAPRLKADMVFLSLPWGGPPYSKAKEYEVESMLRPRPASELMQVVRTISPNVELFLPRNTRHDQFTPGLWASSTQEEFSLMYSVVLCRFAVGCTVYKASGAPVDAFLCRTPKGEDHRRAIPNIIIKRNAMEYSANSSSLRSGAEPQQQRCRRCDGRCGHSESTYSSITVERVLVRQRVGPTGVRRRTLPVPDPTAAIFCPGAASRCSGAASRSSTTAIIFLLH
ncbi:hypothetical protein SFRURICE_010485 [Spodoptera frugiperda]|nr:hypothetical protein SFRURICE_010485 [Spodoptera frugiperda]